MTDRGAHPVQSVLVDGVAEPHLAVKRVLLVIAHQIHQGLKLGRTAEHKETSLLLDTAVFDLTLRPADTGTYRVQGGKAELEKCSFLVFSK